jgi:hypothetical protein
VGLERGPLSLVSITEELLDRKSRGSGSRKTEINGRGDPLRWPRDTLYQLKLALTSPTSGGRSVYIVRLRNEAKVVCTVIVTVSNPTMNVVCLNYLVSEKKIGNCKFIYVCI